MNWLQKLPAPFQNRSLFMKDVVKDIMAGGVSNHTSAGSTLYYVINALEEAGASYQLTAHPGIGYIVQGIPSLKEQLT